MPARLPHPPWHDVYRAAILELDPHKIPVRIECARKNLTERLRHLETRNTPDEHWEVDRALNALRMLALLEKPSNAA